MSDATPQHGCTPELSVVIPCYNESENVRELFERLTTVCEEVIGNEYEIVFVNDGSKDDTWKEILSLYSYDRHVFAINLSRNYGHQIALTAGLSLCRGQRVLIIDADLQDPPELLAKMMAAMDAGADVAYGVRSERLGESWFKRTSASLFYRILARVVDINIPVDTGDFRLISRRALDIVVAMPEQHRFIRGMVSWIGFNQVPIIYMRQPRRHGETNYPLSKMLHFAIDAITGFSIRPLRIASYIGLMTGFFAVLILLYTIYNWANGNVVAGWTSLMSVVLFMGTAQLVVMGIIGEYLGRLYLEAKHRPLFVVQDVLMPRIETNSALPNLKQSELQRQQVKIR
jgi:dolichol-phosphate mannosyltransferase